MVKPVDPTQGAFDFGENPEKPEKRKVGPSQFDEELRKQEDARKEDKRDKSRAKTAENEEFKDKRQPKSDLIRQTEIEKMKEILNKPKVGGGGGGGAAGDTRFLKPKYKSGGKVTASSRADGCCVKGKTKGRMI
jgi:hypothetical protein